MLDVDFLSNLCSMCEQKKKKRQEGVMTKLYYLAWVFNHDDMFPQSRGKFAGLSPSLLAICYYFGNCHANMSGLH